MSVIASGTTTTTALVYTADTSGVLQLQTNGTTTAVTIDTSQNVTFTGKLTSASSLVLASNGSTTAVTIDTAQNVGVGVTPSSGRLTVKGTTTDNSTTAITVSDSVGTGLFYVRNDGLVNTGASTNSPYNATTASSANLLVTSSGTLSRATSALKYKTDVRDLESVDLTKFRPIRYKSTCENDDKTIDHIGFIADEYVSTYPELVTFGVQGQVEGFAYERMTAVLCKTIQELSAKVTALEAKVA